MKTIKKQENPVKDRHIPAFFKDLCQLFEIQVRKSKPDLHFHFGHAYHLCISETMMLFCCTEKSLYGFFSFAVQFFAASCVTDIFTYFKVIIPYMLCDHFCVVFTFRTPR